MNDWHGYVIQDGDEALHIGTLPNRKKPCLYFSVSNKFVCQITPIATFRTESMAKAAMKFLDKAIFGKQSK